MTLQDRLVQARDDYRSIVPPDATRSSDGPPRRRRWPAMAVAAAILFGAALGVASWSGTDDAQKLTATPSPKLTPDPLVKDPDPSGAVAPYEPQIELVQPGPYRDGETITVRVPEGFANDLPHGAQVCAVVADDVGGPSETCDPRAVYTGGAATTTETTVLLRRTLFTPTGMRDCEEPELTCRVVVRAADNLPMASAPLRFDDTPSTRTEWVKVDPTSQGAFRVSVPSVAEAQTWLDPRPSDLEPVATNIGLYLTICAFSTSTRADGPFGDYLWSFSPGDNLLPSANCDAIGRPIVIDSAEPAAPVDLTPSRWFLGQQGWSDCRVDHCFVQLHRTEVEGSTSGGATIVRDEPVGAALLNGGEIPLSGGRAVLAIDTPGPHRAGNEVTVSVSGLPDGYSTNVGVCHVTHPWACGYVGSVFGQIDNGTHTFRLPETLACAPRGCYLELDSKGEGVPPLAVAPLDTPA